ncbi:hypothetical protein QUW14_01710 [Bacteroides gallinaceum]|uniref:hypothetical protein n=1 Tax=Bacteroides gallinaceum TaxID=1462571 RepID=UPI0025A3F5DD|nr:hypothetical protein [Bacteroides gallinaceum]MDM8153041.1 hypothetical protein [Bacteroides gallinaceum]
MKERDLFFKFDLLLCSIWGLFVIHLWVSNLLASICLEEATKFTEWTFPFVAYAVLIRVSLSFMMLRKEKYGWMTAVICLFCGLLCHFVLPESVMADAQRDMYNYGNIAVNYTLSPRWITTELPPYSSWKAWNFFLPLWLWLMPLIYFLCQRKKCVQTRTAKITFWNGLYFWNDPFRCRYLTYCSLFIIAWCAGIVMNEWLSLVVMLLLPAYSYFFVNRKNGRKAYWYEYLGIAFSAGCFWCAQYVTNDTRNVCLVVSVVIALLPIIYFAAKTKKYIKAALAYVMVGVLLPSFCLGYDVYTVKDAARKQNYRDDMCLTGVLIVEDENGNVGLRDRYRLVVPMQYSDVQPYRLPLVSVKYNGELNLFNTGRAGYAKGDYSLLKPNEQNMRNEVFVSMP